MMYAGAKQRASVWLVLSVFALACFEGSDTSRSSSDLPPLLTGVDFGAPADLPVPGSEGDGLSLADAGVVLDAGADPDDVGEEPPEADTTAADVALPEVDAGEAGGAFGDPCASDEDCGSGLCTPTQDGRVCSIGCEDADCPEGFRCATAFGAEGAAGRFCLSRTLQLCRPCAASQDCVSPGGDPQDRCVRLEGEGGSFCGLACGPDGACPQGTSCREVAAAVGSVTVLQCLPDSGTCTCSAWAVEQAASTPCLAGGCEGVRRCTDEGLSACEPLCPGEEICDGADNDCDGHVDEDFLWVGEYVHDEHCGACSQSCEGTIPNGRARCEPGPEGPACVLSSCDPGYELDGAGGCRLEEVCDQDEECDDGDACTTDRCTAKKSCAHLAVSCDDGLPCTADACDKVAGCRNPPEPDGTRCDDGDGCTESDYCSAARCLPGAAVDCNDDNPCTDDTCTQGACAHEPNDHGEACYEGPAATEGVGACAPGMRRCSYGDFGPCEGQVLPETESCDRADNDCDGETDEGCPPGDVQLQGVALRLHGAAGRERLIEITFGGGLRSPPHDPAAERQLDLGLYPSFRIEP